MMRASIKPSHQFKWTGTEGVGAMKKEFSEILVEAIEAWIEKDGGKKLTPYHPSGNYPQRNSFFQSVFIRDLNLFG